MDINFQDYYEIIDDTLILQEDNLDKYSNLEFSTFIKFFTFIDKQISNLNITTITLNKLFKIRYVDHIYKEH